MFRSPYLTEDRLLRSLDVADVRLSTRKGEMQPVGAYAFRTYSSYLLPAPLHVVGEIEVLPHGEELFPLQRMRHRQTGHVHLVVRVQVVSAHVIPQV